MNVTRNGRHFVEVFCIFLKNGIFSMQEAMFERDVIELVFGQFLGDFFHALAAVASDLFRNKQNKEIKCFVKHFN